MTTLSGTGWIPGTLLKVVQAYGLDYEIFGYNPLTYLRDNGRKEKANEVQKLHDLSVSKITKKSKFLISTIHIPFKHTTSFHSKHVNFPPPNSL